MERNTNMTTERPANTSIAAISPVSPLMPDNVARTADADHRESHEHGITSTDGIETIATGQHAHEYQGASSEKAALASQEQRAQHNRGVADNNQEIIGPASPPPPDYTPPMPNSKGINEQHQPQKEAPSQMVTPLNLLGVQPATVDCPRCKAQVLTTIRKEAGDKATTWSIIVCLCAGICFAWIPCVMDDCKDTIHSCSACNAPLATVTPDGSVKVNPSAAPAMQVHSQYARPTQVMAAGQSNSWQQSASPANHTYTSGGPPVNSSQPSQSNQWRQQAPPTNDGRHVAELNGHPQN